MRSEHYCLARRFGEICKYKIIFSKISDLFFTSTYFSIEANTKFKARDLP